MGTAVGLSSDLTTGVIDRFRTLPMARSAILAGRTLSDLLASVLCGTHRADHRLRHRLATRQRLLAVLGGLAVAVLFAYALSWFTACVGPRRRTPSRRRPSGSSVPAGVRVERVRADPGPAELARTSPTGTRCRRWPRRP